MPAGDPWFKKAPKLFPMPDCRYWHVYREPYEPLSTNRCSEGRFALTRSLGMFYVADTMAGAMWETILRNVAPDDVCRVNIEAADLDGFRVAELCLEHPVPQCLHLNDPRNRHLFPQNSKEAKSLRRHVTTPVHSRTRIWADRLRSELSKVGLADLPPLCWQSNQLSSSQAYLLYEPPMESSWWRVVGAAIELDTQVGRDELQRELNCHGFKWAPGDAY